jgi:hypothetical protein
MSASDDVLIGTSQDLASFVNTLNNLLGISLKPNESDGAEGYVFRNDEIWMYVWINDLVNDRWLNFEDYNLHINILYRCVQGVTGEQMVEASRLFARHCFEKLKETNAYRLMLVHDVQVLMDVFAPDCTDKPLDFTI